PGRRSRQRWDGIPACGCDSVELRKPAIIRVGADALGRVRLAAKRKPRQAAWRGRETCGAYGRPGRGVPPGVAMGTQLITSAWLPCSRHACERPDQIS